MVMMRGKGREMAKETKRKTASGRGTPGKPKKHIPYVKVSPKVRDEKTMAIIRGQAR